MTTACTIRYGAECWCRVAQDRAPAGGRGRVGGGVPGGYFRCPGGVSPNRVYGALKASCVS